MIYLKVLCLILIYDIIGFYVNRNILNLKTYFNVPIGFVFLLGGFQLITFPLMFFNMNFKLVYLGILPVIILFCLWVLFKNFNEYINEKKNAFRDHDFLFSLFVTFIFALIIIPLTISSIDQVAYATPTTSTVMTNIIYYNSDFHTIDSATTGIHGLNSVPLFNAMWIKLFNVSTLDFLFIQFRIVEAFIIIGMYSLINQLYFKSQKSTLLLFTIGLLGINLFSSTPFSFDDAVLVFAGNLGTLYMFILTPALMLLFFKVDNKLIYYIFAIVLFTFAVTYSLIPVLFIVGAVLTMIYEDNRYFIYGLLLIFFALMFYVPNYFYIFIIFAIITLIMYKLFKNNKYIVPIVYAITIVGLVLYNGPINLIFGDTNQKLAYLLLAAFFFKFSKNYDKKILKFILLMFMFVFLIQSRHMAFAASVVCARATVFFMMPFLIIDAIDNVKWLKQILLVIFSCSLLLTLTCYNEVPNKIDFQQYLELREIYGSHEETMIANKNTSQLMTYPFEKNADLFILDNWEIPLTVKSSIKYTESNVKYLNMYVGIINVYHQNTTDYCVNTTDCYVLLNKEGASNGQTVKINYGELNVAMETEDFYLIRVNSSDELKQIIKETNER